MFDKSDQADGTFSRANFIYNARQDAYTCPGGKLLTRFQRRHCSWTDQPHADGFFRHRASKSDCDGYALKPRCCPNSDPRKVMRPVHEGARDLARTVANEDEWLTSGTSARRSRCSSDTSSASFGSIASDYAVQTAPETSSTSLLPPRTSGLAKLIPMRSVPAPA